MIVLGIDTATELVSVALVDGDEVLAASESQSDRRHAEDLTPMLQFVVQRAGIEFSEVDAVAVDVGPGLFTGMRVGIAAAQALAHVLSVPLVGVDSLEVLVAAAGNVDDHELVVPVIDTRRREVAWALHRTHDDGTVRRVAPPQVGTMDDMLAAIRERSQSCLFVGAHAISHEEQIRGEIGPQAWALNFGSSLPRYPHARHVALLGHARVLRDGDDSGHAGRRAEGRELPDAPTVRPMYLRDADAEISWTTRDARGVR